MLVYKISWLYECRDIGENKSWFYVITFGGNEKGEKKWII